MFAACGAELGSIISTEKYLVSGQIFHVLFISKIYVKNFRNLHQLAAAVAPKNLHRKFSVLQKNLRFHIHCMFHNLVYDMVGSS